jgi:tetratricopeptide (TPR) repeat protein
VPFIAITTTFRTLNRSSSDDRSKVLVPLKTSLQHSYNSIVPEVHVKPLILSLAISLLCAGTPAELNSSAETFYANHQFAEAKAAFEQALSASEAAGDNNAQAFALNGLALIADQEKRYNDAEALYKRALEKKQLAVGKDSPDLIPITMNYARLEHGLKKWDEAQALYESALAKEDDTKRGSAQHVTDLTYYAQLMVDRGNKDKAEQLLRQALALVTAELGAGSRPALNAKTNLARFMAQKPDVGEATKLYTEVVQGFRALNDTSEMYAAALTNLAAILREQQKYEEADPYAREAITVLEKATPPEPKRLITAEINLGKLLIEESQFDEARKLLETVLADINAIYGPDSDRALEPLTDLAELASMAGDTDKSIALLEQSAAIAKKSLPPTSPEARAAVENLGNAYRNAGKYDKAMPLYQEFVERQKKVFGETSKETADALDDIALMQREQGDAGAEATFKQVLAIREQLATQEPGELATSLNNAGKMYRDEGKYDEAEAMFKRALQIREKTFGAKDASVAATLRNYAVLMRKKGNVTKADELDARAEAIESP